MLNGQCHKYGVDIVGTVGGAVTTFAAVQALSPDLVINAGTCGGFRAMMVSLLRFCPGGAL